jgi:hypothetical protein
MNHFSFAYINDKGVLSMESKFFGDIYELAGVKEIQGSLFFIYNEQ